MASQNNSDGQSSSENMKTVACDEAILDANMLAPSSITTLQAPVSETEQKCSISTLVSSNDTIVSLNGSSPCAGTVLTVKDIANYGLKVDNVEAKPSGVVGDTRKQFNEPAESVIIPSPSNTVVKQELNNNPHNLALINNNLASQLLNSKSVGGSQQTPITIKEEPSDLPTGIPPEGVQGIAALMGIPGDAACSNTSIPPVNNGICLLCGDESCGTNGITCASDDESEDKEEKDGESDPDKDFLPPPPMSSVEVDKLFSKLVEQDKEIPMEPASVIMTDMYLHQKQALQWMVTRENSNELGPFWKETQFRGEWYNEGTRCYTSERPNCIKGGILADDMGLGKTLTIIALIFTNHINGKPMFLKKEIPSKKRKASSGVCQEAAISQPKKPCINITSDEDESQTAAGSQQGLPCKDTIPQQGLSCKDTSPNDDEKIKVENLTKVKKEKNVVAIKKRKEGILNNKRLQETKKGKNPGEKFRKLFLPTYLKKKNKVGIAVKKEQPAVLKSPESDNTTCMNIDDTDDDDIMIEPVTKQPNTSLTPNVKIVSTNPANQDVAKATLIICPLSVLSNWTDQICTHVNPAVSIRVYLYYGAQRITDIEYLKKQDIILTTYPTIANDYRKSGNSPLYKIRWLRIILDEGHTIRNKRTTMSKSVLDLEAERRWVITGTPIQNRIEDLWVLLLFLRLEPFNDKKWWKMMIANILQKRRLAELADFRLNALIKHISIRRLKDEKVNNNKLVELPPKQVVIQDIELSEEERKLYDMMQLKGQKTIRRYIREDSVLKHYGHCFFIIMRLRQMCICPQLCKETLSELKAALQQAEEAEDNQDDTAEDNEDNAHLIKILIEAITAGDSEECAVCLESLTDPVITPCAHVFCSACIRDVLQSEGLAPTCPMCRGPVSESDLVEVPEDQLRNINSDQTNNDDDSTKDSQFEGSAKITALISSLEAIREKDPSIKSVVVSQFTSFLNIVAEYLDRRDFHYLRLDGKMKLNERTKALEDFSDDGSATVFLLSMSAGGTGISLTAASRVFLMDPAWNPAVEEQCFDRCHRMGQTNEVIITKYIVMDSIEERMLTLQDQKRALMTDAFGAKAQSEEDRRRTRVRDIAHLMGLQAARPAVHHNAFIA